MEPPPSRSPSRGRPPRRSSSILPSSTLSVPSMSGRGYSHDDRAASRDYSRGYRPDYSRSYSGDYNEDDLDQEPSSTREQEEREEWRRVTDHDERRRIQNRQAQRRFREKEKARREARTLEAANQQAASGAYASPDASDLDPDNGQSGLPWGGVSIRHVVERGKKKSEESRTRRTSRETSVGGGYWSQSQGGYDEGQGWSGGYGQGGYEERGYGDPRERTQGRPRDRRDESRGYEGWKSERER